MKAGDVGIADTTKREITKARLIALAERNRIDASCGLLRGALGFTLCRKGHPLKDHA